MKIATALALFLTASIAVASTPPAQTYSVPAYGGVPLQLLGQQPGLSAADAKRIIELLESIDRRLEAIEAKTGGPVPLLQKKVELLPVAKAKCAACHTPSKADAKGGGFVLFANDDATVLQFLKADAKRAVKQAVQDGSMPKNGKLTAEEKSAFNW